MQQVFITISSAHNHKQDMRIDDYQEWLQERLTSGEPWSKILVEIEASNENYEYFKTDTTQTFIDGLNNNDMTDYFAVLNIPPQPLEDVLHPENWKAENSQETEKPLTFEQRILEHEKGDPAFYLLSITCTKKYLTI